MYETGSLSNSLIDIETSKNDLTSKFHKLKTKYVYLLNRVSHLQGSVKVFYRVRAFNEAELAAQEASVAQLDDAMSCVDFNKLELNNLLFECDYVFPSSSTQDEVFLEVRYNIVLSIFPIHCCCYYVWYDRWSLD